MGVTEVAPPAARAAALLTTITTKSFHLSPPYRASTVWLLRVIQKKFGEARTAASIDR